MEDLNPVGDWLDEIAYDPSPYQLKIPSNFPQPVHSKALTQKSVALGRKLFFDPILSKNNVQSCSSCHSQEKAFSDSPLQFSLGVDGLPGKFNAMPLINLAWSPLFFWDGRRSSLEDQALDPINDPLEMHSNWNEAAKKLNDNIEYRKLFKEAYNTKNIDSSHVVDALASFEMTLISSNSKFDKFIRQQAFFTIEEQLGQQIFLSESRGDNLNRPPGGDCFHCHTVGGNPLTTNYEFFNNGLDANPKPGLMTVTGRPEDRGKFKTPSLKNIALTAPYMHDGRFETLQEVIEHYNSGVKDSPTLDPNLRKDNRVGTGLNLTQPEKDALLAFLLTFTDEEFLTNPDFGPPSD